MCLKNKWKSRNSDKQRKIYALTLKEKLMRRNGIISRLSFSNFFREQEIDTRFGKMKKKKRKKKKNIKMKEEFIINYLF